MQAQLNHFVNHVIHLGQQRDENIINKKVVLSLQNVSMLSGSSHEQCTQLASFSHIMIALSLFTTLRMTLRQHYR